MYMSKLSSVTILQPAGACDFESAISPFCTWTNVVTGDDFDWLIGSGSTLSLNTGPQADNTIGDDRGNDILILLL